MQRKKTKSKMKDIPKFKNEDEERDFWATHSVLDFPDRFKRVELDLSRLKPSTSPVTVRLPISLLDDLKTLANRRDVPYQSLMKILLAQKLADEFRKLRQR